MNQPPSLSLSEKNKLSEIIRQQYKILGDEAICSGNVPLAKHYYRLSDRSFEIFHSAHQGAYSIVLSLPSEKIPVIQGL